MDQNKCAPVKQSWRSSCLTRYTRIFTQSECTKEDIMTLMTLTRLMTLKNHHYHHHRIIEPSHIDSWSFVGCRQQASNCWDYCRHVSQIVTMRTSVHSSNNIWSTKPSYVIWITMLLYFICFVSLWVWLPLCSIAVSKLNIKHQNQSVLGCLVSWWWTHHHAESCWKAFSYHTSFVEWHTTKNK